MQNRLLEPASTTLTNYCMDWSPERGGTGLLLDSLFHVFVYRYRHDLIANVEVGVDFLHIVVLF